MIPEDSDSWLITALSDEIWCFHMFSRVTSLPLRCQYQPQESLSESSFFRGTESWLLFKGTSAKEYRDLDTTQTAYGIFWPKVDQSSKYQSTCLWRWCFCSCSCNATGDPMIIGYHWFSSWGVLAILEDFLTGKTIWLTKTPKTQSSVSLTVFSSV